MWETNALIHHTQIGCIEHGVPVEIRHLRKKQSLLRRPESNIAVVTHSSFLDATFNSLGVGYSPAVKGEMQRWFDNCEMRTVIVADVVDPLPEDQLHYRGGANSGVGHGRVNI